MKTTRTFEEYDRDGNLTRRVTETVETAEPSTEHFTLPFEGMFTAPPQTQVGSPFIGPYRIVTYGANQVTPTCGLAVSGSTTLTQ